MNFEVTYTEWKDHFFSILANRMPRTGSQVQDWVLHDTDESKLTPRERLIFILIAIIYEVEHNMLTEELSDELYFYYQDLQEGRLDGILGKNEEEQIKADIIKYYSIVQP